MVMNNVLVTGSSAGIGLAIAQHFENSGHRVFKTGRREIPDSGANYFRADLKNSNEIAELYEAAFRYLGGIDILVNNAGEYLHREIERMAIGEITGMMSLNLIAPYYMTSLVVPGMKNRGRGRIINIGSISGSVGEGHASLYSATKAGLMGMTKALALELAPYGITVNTINPGWVKTDLVEHAGIFNEAEVLDTIPQRRFIEPIEIAKMIEYLVSDGARGVTGQSINLCAGLSVGC